MRCKYLILSVLCLALLASCGRIKSAQLAKRGMIVDKELTLLCVDVPFSSFWFNLSAPVLDFSRNYTKLAEGVEHKVISIELADNQTLNADIYWHKGEEWLTNRPCLLYLHGGGGGYKAAPHHCINVSQYTAGAHCVTIMPDYHLIPEAVFPAPQIEMLAIYQWLMEHADELGIDNTRIAVGGDSSGAYMSAMLSTMLAEQGLPLPICQMLIYPGLDSERSTELTQTYTFTPVWNTAKNEKFWHDYNRDNYPKEEASLLFRPMPEGLPATYLETAEWDCLRDEGVCYVEKLRDAGVEVVYNASKGTFHAYDMNMKTNIVKHNIAQRVAFLQTYLQD